MAIEYRAGEMLDGGEGTLVLPVGCTAGDEQELQERFPEAIAEHTRRCRLPRGHPARPVPGEPYPLQEDERALVLFPLRTAAGQPVRLDVLARGLRRIAREYRAWIGSGGTLVLPRLVDPADGLDWLEDVCPLIEEYLGGLPITVIVTIHAEERDDTPIDGAAAPAHPDEPAAMLMLPAETWGPAPPIQQPALPGFGGSIAPSNPGARGGRSRPAGPRARVRQPALSAPVVPNLPEHMRDWLEAFGVDAGDLTSGRTKSRRG